MQLTLSETEATELRDLLDGSLGDLSLRSPTPTTPATGWC